MHHIELAIRMQRCRTARVRSNDNCAKEVVVTTFKAEKHYLGHELHDFFFVGSFPDGSVRIPWFLYF